MPLVPWKKEINFASALLLHSCITVILKEISNTLTILYRLTIRRKRKAETDNSVVLDGYTLILSRDSDGELAELYFTNTGMLLLTISLASAIIMNLTLPIKILNALVAATFGLTFLASMLVARRKRSVVMPIMALRRAGRFIWSDTPFLVLRDYVSFRSIAILELLFMKARLAASDPVTQQTLLRRLLNSEYVMVKGKDPQVEITPPRPLRYDRIVPFTTSQRLFVMFYKTAIGHAYGSLCGISGPTTISIPASEGLFIDEAEQYGWRIYRISPGFLILEDCGQIMVTKRIERRPTKERKEMLALYNRFISWTHGVLLRRLGRRRVVWLMRIDGKGHVGSHWRGNINLFTGVKESWLQDRSVFQRVSDGSVGQESRET
ncbi:hypothetical protein CC80DRAFT_477906, partial [Byssothecium circinans]